MVNVVGTTWQISLWTLKELILCYVGRGVTHGTVLLFIVLTGDLHDCTSTSLLEPFHVFIYGKLHAKAVRTYNYLSCVPVDIVLLQLIWSSQEQTSAASFAFVISCCRAARSEAHSFLSLFSSTSISDTLFYSKTMNTTMDFEWTFQRCPSPLFPVDIIHASVICMPWSIRPMAHMCVKYIHVLHFNSLFSCYVQVNNGYKASKHALQFFSYLLVRLYHLYWPPQGSFRNI